MSRRNPQARTFPPMRAMRASVLAPAPTPRYPSDRSHAAGTIRGRTPIRAPGALLLDLPIAWRLALGFLLAALVAAAAAGITGLQRTQALSNQSSFYESLLRTNTSLTTGDSFLQLMNTKVHDTLSDASVPNPSKETLAADQSAISGLADRYDTILSGYQRGDLIAAHPDQVAIVSEANRAIQVTQQRTFAQSAARTWQVYRVAQAQVLQDITTGDIASAQALERAQGEPTNADAQSALRALIQFDGRIATTIREAADIEQRNQGGIALIAALIAFLVVAAIGWVISNTLVRRLRHLRRVTLAVEQGQLATRAVVVGRDEIANVSHAVNGMLDTIVGLLDVTRRQRDALTTAAERLFADVRVAGAGDLRVNATVSGDPIGMLANAFNFTVGRFRRFVLRTHTTVDQLDVVARQQYEHAAAFYMRLVRISRVSTATPPAEPPGAHSAAPTYGSDHFLPVADRVEGARELVRQLAREGASAHAPVLLDLSEQAYLSAGRVSQMTLSMYWQTDGASGAPSPALNEELRTLGSLLVRLASEAQSIRGGSDALLAELDGQLVQLATTGVAGATGAAYGSAASSHASAGDMSASVQLADLMRLAGSFTQDVAELARQVGAITHEMRTGLSPFRLDLADDKDIPLYAPGAGYDEPVGAHQPPPTLSPPYPSSPRWSHPASNPSGLSSRGRSLPR